MNRLGAILIVAFSTMTSLATAEESKRPKGDYLFASGFDNVVMKPSIVNIADGKKDSSIIELRFRERAWKGAIHFRLIERGVITRGSRGRGKRGTYRPKKYWAFDTVLTIDQASQSLILSGRVGEDGALTGTILFHAGVGRAGGDPVAAVGTFAMNKKK